MTLETVFRQSVSKDESSAKSRYGMQNSTAQKYTSNCQTEKKIQEGKYKGFR